MMSSVKEDLISVLGVLGTLIFTSHLVPHQSITVTITFSVSLLPLMLLWVQ